MDGVADKGGFKGYEQTEAQERLPRRGCATSSSTETVGTTRTWARYSIGTISPIMWKRPDVKLSYSNHNTAFDYRGTSLAVFGHPALPGVNTGKRIYSPRSAEEPPHFRVRTKYNSALGTGLESGKMSLEGRED